MAKVYVSSTVADLVEERRAVMDWLTADGHQPVHSYRPDSDTVRDSCLDDVASCDLYVLILGYRYGRQPEEGNPDGLSITHLEFRRAGDAGIPRVALLRLAVPDIRLSDLLDPRKASLVQSFQDEVRRSVRPAEFRDSAELIAGLSTGVHRALEKVRGKYGETTTGAPDESRRFIYDLMRQLDQKDAENAALRQTVAKLESALRAELPPPPVGVQQVAPPTAEMFDQAKNEAAVVGSSLLLFPAGVTVERREVIVNSLLFAQLAASGEVADQTRVYEWYDAYLRSLRALGWAADEVSFAEYQGAAKDFETLTAILAMAKTVFRAKPTALAIVTSAVNALRWQDDGSPSISIFDRETCHGKTARFQIGLAEQDRDGQFFVDLMAFGLKAKSTITQPLSFKSEKSKVTLQYSSARFSINTVILDGIGEHIAARLREYMAHYIRQLPGF